MKLVEFILSDGLRHSAYSKRHWLIEYCINRSLWACLQYRVANSVYKSELPIIIKKPVLILMVLWQYIIEWITTIKLPYKCEIGKGLYIGHPNCIILNANAVIGNYCNLSQGVTIGVSGIGENRGVPVIGDFVYVGANATIAGKISIGDECIVAANSLVTRSVCSNCLAIGVPAETIKSKSALPYILPVK